MANQSDPWAAFRKPAAAPAAADPRAAFRPQVQPDQNVPQAFANAFQPSNILPALPVTPDTMRQQYLLAQQGGDEAGRKAYAEGFVRQEQKQSPKTMALADSTRQIFEGVPVLGGLADEINAAAAAPLSAAGITDPKAYQEALDYQRARDSVVREDHPAIAGALNLLGGVASSGAVGKVAGPVLAAMPRIGATATGLVGGAAIGGADMFARGEGTQDRIEKGLTGAAIGGAVGAVAPVVAEGVSKLWSAGSDLAAKVSALRGLGLSLPTAKVLARAVEADPSAAANIAEAGPRGMLADAGPTMQGQLDQVIARGGKGADFARGQVEQRAAGGADDINAALDRSLGAPQGVATTVAALREDSSPAVKAAYKQAYSTPIDYADPKRGFALTDLLNRVPASAINEANALMRVEGHQSQQILAKIADDGTVTYTQLPDVRQWDYITRALSNPSAASEGAGIMGGKTPIGAAYGKLSGEIRDILGGARANGKRSGGLVPAYGTALGLAEAPIKAKQALEFGAGMMSPGVARDGVVQTMQGMSAAERDSVRQGIRSQIDEKLANIKAVMSDPNVDARQAIAAIKDFSSDAARTKLRIVLGKQDADSLIAQIDQTAKSFNLRAAVAGNSRTYGRKAAEEGVTQATDPGLVGKFLAGEPIAGGKATVQAVTGMGPKYQLARQDRIYDELGRAMTERRGDDAIALLEQLQRANNISGTGARVGQTLGGLAGGATFGAGLDQGRKGQIPLLSDLLRQ